MRPEWERWRDWYQATSRSTGFAPPREGPPPVVTDPRVAALVEASTVIYEDLRTHAL